MLPVFCLRLAAGMTACLLLLSPAASAGRRPNGTESVRSRVNPAFFRTHFLVTLGLACVALLFLRGAAPWHVLTAVSAGLGLAFMGSLSWSLEGSPGGRGLVVLTALALGAGLGLLEARLAVLGGLASAALLGAALSAMLLGHSYLIAPGLSIAPLLRLLAAVAVALAARLAADGYALGRWTGGHSLGKLTGENALWLPVRWAVGFAAPLGLVWMAWQTAKIRSTQSATGILYVVVIFCFLGELLAQLLRPAGLTL
jgi:hypothetical protein